MIPQYRIFYSWQSDNQHAKELLQQALDEVKNQLKCKGIAVQIEQGGGGGDRGQVPVPILKISVLHTYSLILF